MSDPQKNMGETALEKTFVPGQTAAMPPKSTSNKLDNETVALDVTYVPGATVTNLPTPQSASKETSGQKVAKMNEPAQKKSGSSQLGKYKLLKKLGQGGMGEVYLAEDVNLGRKAAIKVLSKALAGNADFVKRFYKEARAMARVNHENAVSVYDVDQERNIHYVAMEFVDGKSMQKWMDTLGKLSVADALHVTLRCAEALQLAHGENLIHRDIKPDNIMLTSKGKVKVADFGLAKATDEDLSMTASGTGLGTPYYMAPEQARNAKHVDGRADIYALGVTLYYFVTGKLPFAGNSALEVITAKEKGKFESARKLNPQVSDRLDLMIAKMLEKDMDRRVKSCDEVISMLGGLGLDNASLSFIDVPGKATTASHSSPSHESRPAQRPSPAAVTRPGPAPVHRSSAEDAESHRPRTGDAAATANNWIVQMKAPGGRETVSKLTTAQIQTALRTGSLDIKTKIKKNAADAFMPVGFFPEFERAVEGRNIKEKAEARTAGLKAEFAKIGRQYDRRAWVRWFRDMASNTVGLIKFLIWIGFVFGGIAALIIFRAQAWDAFANFWNSHQK